VNKLAVQRQSRPLLPELSELFTGFPTFANFPTLPTLSSLRPLFDNRVLRLEDEVPLIEANPALTAPIAHQLYLPTEVVFTTGLADGGDHYIVASGEADLACRISHVPTAVFEG